MIMGRSADCSAGARFVGRSDDDRDVDQASTLVT
jgi:hypothetical protein